jgi:hypothetical protein
VVLPTTRTSGQKFWDPAVARLAETQSPSSSPRARRRSASAASKSKPPLAHTSLAGKVVAGVRAREGALSQAGLEVTRSLGE